MAGTQCAVGVNRSWLAVRCRAAARDRADPVLRAYDCGGVCPMNLSAH